LKLGARERGFAAFAKAVDKGHVDDAMKRALLIGLEDKKHDGAVAVLVAWPDPALDGALRALLTEEAWWRRHNALEVLEGRKQLTDEERVQVALLDLTSDDCADRRQGLGVLRKLGKDPAALDRVHALGADPLRNACLILELPGAESAIKKRLGG
jgi:hypothetical protein